MKIRRKLLNLTVLALVVLLMGVQLGSFVSYADSPYKTYSVDGYGVVQETQTAYLPYETITKFSEESLNGAMDMFVTEDDTIYIADTGNARIVVGSLDGTFIKSIGEGTLKSPRGVFVTEDGNVYVADRDAGAVFVFDNDGNLLATYGKPDSPLYGSSNDFLPIKIVVNTAGDMYIICESNTNGIVEISPSDGGTFLGYFGTNSSSLSLQEIFLRMISTDAQRAKMVSNLPSTPDNLAIDEKGLIYTVTKGDKYDTLKRLNVSGSNLISPDFYDETPAAVAVGNHDNVFIASNDGFVYEFSNDGELLFIFGGKDDGSQRVGLANTTTAIQIDSSNRILLLDSELNQIQIYEPTEFTNTLHEALYLYSKGRYLESQTPLTKVLQMNSVFDYANQAMGRAYYQQENYVQAEYYAKLAKDYDGYSDAFWEIRNVWIKKNVVTVLVVIVLLYIIWKVLKYYDKKNGIFNGLRRAGERFWNIKFFSNLKYSLYFMKHPMDGCYGVSREGRASYVTSLVLIVIVVIEFIINKYLCGFLQKTVREGRYELTSDIGMIVLLFVGLTACCYLVCTINDGESTIKKLATSFAYSLTPYIVFTPVIFILSHMLTYNEQFLISFMQIFMWAWIVILLFLSIKEVNNYTVKENFKVIFLTIFTTLILALLIFIIYVLWAQVIEFISSIIGEVVYRLGN